MFDDDVPTARVVRTRKPINRKTKKHIVFDPIARREFLTGFRKRKQERKRKAEEELKKQLKEEKKRLKLEAREALTKIIGVHRAAPTIEDLASNEYELKNHSVKIVELSTSDLAKQNNWIGPNKVQYEEEKEDGKSEEEEVGEEVDEEIPGMGLSSVKEVKVALKRKATEEVKNSKAFRLKNKLERQKSKKKARRERRIKKKKVARQNKGKQRKGKRH